VRGVPVGVLKKVNKVRETVQEAKR
jgi:hypothetical protein